MKSKRFLRCILFAALMIGLVPAAMMAAEGDATGSIKIDGTEVTAPTTIAEDATITVTGNAVLNGTGGDAITINANVTMNFDQGATLTVTGYDNAFVIENGTLSGGGWHIIDGDGLDLFRLKNSSELNITSDVDLDGYGSDITTSRAIVLPGSSSGQAVTLGEGCTLAANNFYRAIETGGASSYTISGANSGLEENADPDTVSTFDFSDNDCGMFISYFDTNVNFANCKLEVSDCLTSGIFMRQDNASLNGLYIDNVYINCVNDPGLDQNDIAIRFHTVDFSITDSVINIENAWNTGLWICDGWEKDNTKEIKDTTINVKHVEPKEDLVSSLFGSVNKRKAITLVPFGEFVIDGCTINIDGASATSSSDNEMEGGINVASDIAIARNSSFDVSKWTATPRVYSGKVTLKNTDVTTSGVTGADIGAQVGQWVEIGENVVIDNGKSDDHYTAIRDTAERGFPVNFIGQVQYIQYVTTGMSDYDKSPDRLIVTGGSYWSTDADKVTFADKYDIEKAYSIPVNQYGDDLTLFSITDTAYNEYATADGLEFQSNAGDLYDYLADETTGDGYHYVWAPLATVTFEGTDISYNVPQGAPLGLVASELPEGSWSVNGESFTLDSKVIGNMTATAQ